MDEVKYQAKSLAEAVCRYAGLRTETYAIVDKSGPHTYAQFWDEIVLCAEVLRENGVGKGDRVVMECTQDALFLAVNLSCQLLEAIFVGVERRVARGRLEEIVRQTEPALLITAKKVEFMNMTSPSGSTEQSDGSESVPKENREEGTEGRKTDEAGAGSFIGLTGKEFEAILKAKRAAEAAQPGGGQTEQSAAHQERMRLAAQTAQSLDAQTVSEILFSTGTTGRTKGAVLTNRANVANAQNIIDGVCMEQDAVELVPLPINHAHGLRTSYAHLLNGSTVLIINGITFPRVVFDQMAKFGANAIDLSPSAAQMLINTSAARLKEISPTIRYVEVGAAFLPETTKQMLKECFPASRLYNCYGSSESGRTCNLEFSGDKDMPGCIGLPVPNAAFAVMDPDGKPMRSDAAHTGLLASAGPMNMSGYWKEPELSAQTLRDGYVLTADVSYIDEDGYIFVLGRQDDVIVYKGIKISPEEIEEAALGCSQVADCACIPEADEMAGQVPKLYVVPADRETCSEAELFAYLKEHIDDNRMPRTIELIEAIPRTYNGKILRKELAAKA